MMLSRVRYVQGLVLGKVYGALNMSNAGCILIDDGADMRKCGNDEVDLQKQASKMLLEQVGEEQITPNEGQMANCRDCNSALPPGTDRIWGHQALSGQ